MLTETVAGELKKVFEVAEAKFRREMQATNFNAMAIMLADLMKVAGRQSRHIRRLITGSKDRVTLGELRQFLSRSETELLALPGMGKKRLAMVKRLREIAEARAKQLAKRWGI